MKTSSSVVSFESHLNELLPAIAKQVNPLAKDEMEKPDDSAETGIAGAFDGLDGIYATGWAMDKLTADLPVQLDVFANEHLVASGAANLYRGDLHDAGIGSGVHAFRIPLPAHLCDGEPYDISVRTTTAGIQLPSDAVIFRQSSKFASHLQGLEGACIVGWIRSLDRPDESLTVELMIDGRSVATAQANQRVPEGMRFALRAPSEMLDGLPHVVAVQIKEPFHLVGETAMILPAILTPTDALRQYSTFFSRAALLDGAPARYESLRRQIKSITDKNCTLSAEDQVNYLRQIAETHDQVILGINAAERTSSALSPLVFAKIESPLVSIVIPVHNNALVTFNCLASLLLAHNLASFEVIIVDDGSTDETLDLPGIIEGVRFERQPEALGFVKSCNNGAQHARGQFVCMLNNDTEVTSGWLDELLHAYYHFDKVGMVGAKLLYPNGKLQEAGGIVWNNGDPWNYGREANARDPRFNYTRQVDYLSGACILLSRNLWIELSGFDLRFAPAYFEDADLAFRVRECGLKTIYAPFAEVVHFEGVSNGKSVASGMKRFQEVNKPKFKSRWSRTFKNNGAVGRDVDLNKDRNIRFRALVIDYTTPQQDRDAGSYASVEEMRLLQSLGFKVTFVPDNLAFLADATETLQRMGIECVYAPFILSIREMVEHRGGEFDVIYITRYSIAERHIESIRLFAPQAKVLFNNADLHFLREIRGAISSKSPQDMTRALNTRSDELALMRRVDLVLSYNEAEHAVILSHNLDSTKVARCPWVVNVKDRTPDFDDRCGIAFLGGFTHTPNVEAMEYFVRDVMPFLRGRLPHIRLQIYGSAISERVKIMEADDILIKGWVKDIADVYGSCRVFVAPLISGAGIKGKVIGAFAHGVPCVLSSIAAEGIGIRNGEEAFIADKPEQWVESIASLYERRDLWTRTRDAASKFAATEYSFRRGQELMQAALEAVDIFATPDDAALTYGLRPD